MQEALQRAGVPVRDRNNPARQGQSTGRVAEEDGLMLARVRFDGEPERWVLVDELELAEVPLDEARIVAEGKFTGADLLRRILTSSQLAGDLAEMIYSLDMTNTEFMPHQFKPLLALLDSPSRGVLIADEVGLGKTIEAGLIWTELRFRSHARTMLVVCPAMLIEKWQVELRRRFGTESTVMRPADLLEWIDAPPGHQAPRAIICSMQGLRPPRGWEDGGRERRDPAARLARRLDDLQDRVLFDLTVVDEAHYLRNEETASAALGRLLRPVSDHFVLLSATPVNTRSDDLFNLVSLVDPSQFQFRSQFEQVLEANRPLVLATNALKKEGVTADNVAGHLDAAGESWPLSDSEGLQRLRDGVAGLGPDHALTAAERVDLVEKIQRINLLGHAIVRSRKREVFENRVQRRVFYRKAVMTPAEADLYQLVSEAIVAYALSHQGVEGFLLAMPQQQMASCMYAAAKRWGAGGAGAEVEEFAFESLGRIVNGDAQPVSQAVETAIRGNVDLAALRVEDSKLAVLMDILREQSGDDPQGKVLVFSFFRDTLAYLKERLEAAGYPCTIVQGGDDKQATIDGFRDDPGQRILLATEVAAEGVDLQFMRVMVNYDLPWNPMRVEQRIGRIDRIGQQAPTISIFNLVYADTIDDRIFVRLFDRLKLFEESVGATEEVLGAPITGLTREILSSRLTAQEQEVAAEQTYFAIEQRKRDLAEVEDSEADLVGLGDYVRDRVVRARARGRSISDEDLFKHITGYLEAEAPGYDLQLSASDRFCGTLKLPAGLAARLSAYRESHRLPPSRLESGHAEQVLIRNHVDAGASSGRVELLNQFHPLVRMIAADSTPLVGPRLHAVEVFADDLAGEVAEGAYGFCAEAWELVGVRRLRTVRATFVPVGVGTVLSVEDSFDLLNVIRSKGTFWHAAPDELDDPAAVLKAIDTARLRLTVEHGKELDRFRTENADRARIQQQSVERYRDQRVARLEEVIERHRLNQRKGLERADRARQQRLREHAEVQLARIQAREQVTSNNVELAAGVVRVRA